MKLKHSLLLSAAICISNPVAANTIFATLDDVNAATDTYFLNFSSSTFGAVVDNGNGDGEMLHAYWDNNQLVFPTAGFLTYKPNPVANGSLISFATNNRRQTLNELYFQDLGSFLIEPMAGYQVDSIDYQINFAGGNNGIASGIYLLGGTNSRDVKAQWAAGSSVQTVVPGQIMQIETQSVQTSLTFLLPNLGETSALTVMNDSTLAELPPAADGSSQEVFGSSILALNQQVFRQSEGTDSFIGGVRDVFMSTLIAEGNVAGIGSFTGVLGIESIRMSVNTSPVLDSVISVPWPSMAWLWCLGLPLTALIARRKQN
jgi:hypothetical protein